MRKFEKRFFSVLNEQDEERGAMVKSLDQGTNPEDFDLNMDAETVPDHAAAAAEATKAIAARHHAMVGQIQGWVTMMEETLEKLNGQGPDSIQSALAGAEPETILDKMKHSEQRKIARVATELAALTESFKGYLAQSGNAALKGV